MQMLEECIMIFHVHTTAGKHEVSANSPNEARQIVQNKTGLIPTKVKLAAGQKKPKKS